MAHYPKVNKGFFIYSGVTGEMYDQWKNSESSMDIKPDGDNWIIDYKTTMDPSMNKVYTFKSGKEQETTDPSGNIVKVNGKPCVNLLYYCFNHYCNRGTAIRLKC